jgi:predicted transcriptional regulator
MSPEEAAKRIGALQVSEIMIPLSDYPKVSDHFTLRRAIKILRAARELQDAGRKSVPRALLVLDPEDKLVGIVRRRDIMRGLVPKYLAGEQPHYQKELFGVAVDPNLAELSINSVIAGMRERANRPVSEVMRPLRMSINHDDHIIKAVNEMVTTNRAILPVVRRGRVVGVLRSLDVFRELARLTQ